MVTSNSAQSLSGRYVHIDYLKIECESPIVFDVDLLDVSCTTYDDYIEVDVLFSDSTNVEIEYSVDGIDWNSIGSVEGSYVEYQHKTQTPDNYYRVKYEDSYSNVVHCYQDNIVIEEKELKEILYFNTLGQPISKEDAIQQVHVETKIYNDGSAKSDMRPRQIH